MSELNHEREEVPFPDPLNPRPPAPAFVQPTPPTAVNAPTPTTGNAPEKLQLPQTVEELFAMLPPEQKQQWLSQMAGVGTPIMPPAHAVPSTPTVDPNVDRQAALSPAVAAFQQMMNESTTLVGAGAGDLTGAQLLEIIKAAQAMPFDRIMTAASLVVDLAGMLEADSRKVGRPIPFTLALQSIHRVSGILLERPHALAELASIFS
jgi:hypothetical protein